jgi:hypothetical protein
MSFVKLFLKTSDRRIYKALPEGAGKAKSANYSR